LAWWRPGSFTAHTPARPARSRHAWARNKQGPSPARCSRPRPHRTHTRACLRVPASPDSLKYALQTHRARHFPCKARPSTALLALPRYLISFASSFCHTAVPFVSPSPVLLRYIKSSSLLFRFRIQIIASCMHAPARTEVTHAPT
jgi:hypothetical protein